MDLESLTIKVARSENLPILPQIVSSVLKTVDDEDVSARAIEKVIEREPAIAAKILRAANSAYYGQNNVPTVARAVGVLGLNTIRSLVVALAYQQIAGGRTHAQCFNKLEFWRHSLATATTARIIAKLKLPLKSEEVYMAGMLHDLGMLVLDRFAPADFEAALRMSKDRKVPLFEAEREVYGYDHCQVGAILADKWSLPAIISSAIRFHHDVSQDGDCFETTCIVAAAEALAHRCGFDNNSPPGEYVSDPVVEESVGLPPEQMVIIGKVMSDEVARTQEAFQIAA